MALDDDLRAEIDFHIDMRTEKHLNAGMTPAEAGALARAQFGDMCSSSKAPSVQCRIDGLPAAVNYWTRVSCSTIQAVSDTSTTMTMARVMRRWRRRRA